MIVDQKYKLLALHRVFMQAKFDGDPSDSAIPFSPIVAEMANQVLEEIVAILKQENNLTEATSWERWRLVEPSRKEFLLIEKRFQECVEHNPQEGKEREELLMVLSAPLMLSESAKSTILGR